MNNLNDKEEAEKVLNTMKARALLSNDQKTILISEYGKPWITREDQRFVDEEGIIYDIEQGSLL